MFRIDKHKHKTRKSQDSANDLHIAKCKCKYFEEKKKTKYLVLLSNKVKEPIIW
jgi:hypothetical protein